MPREKITAVTLANHWKISFHLVPTCGKDKCNCTMKDIHENDFPFDWLKVKSTIENAELGLFAAGNFQKGHLTEICVGTEKCNETFECSVKWKHGTLHHHSFQTAPPMENDDTKTMGMQMANDLISNSKTLPVKKLKTIAEMDSDLLIHDSLDIKKGDKNFIMSHLTHHNQ